MALSDRGRDGDRTLCPGQSRTARKRHIVCVVLRPAVVENVVLAEHDIGAVPGVGAAELHLNACSHCGHDVTLRVQPRKIEVIVVADREAAEQIDVDILTDCGEGHGRRPGSQENGRQDHP